MPKATTKKPSDTFQAKNQNDKTSIFYKFKLMINWIYIDSSKNWKINNE